MTKMLWLQPILTHILVTGDEKILNEVDVPVLTHETCTDWYEAENILIDKEQHVCAGYEQGGLDACQGDSGGPFGKSISGQLPLNSSPNLKVNHLQTLNECRLTVRLYL